VTNNGPDTATGVHVSDPLPTQVSYVSVSTAQGTCTGGAVIDCQLGTMTVGQSVVITVVVTANETGTVTNTTTVVGSEPEPNTTNNTATTTTRVVGPATPPVACANVRVTPRALVVAKRTALNVRVTGSNGRGLGKALVTARGPGINKSATTNSAGRAKLMVKASRAGILQVRVSRVRGAARCSTRVGVVGVFRPPVTG
jgi:hypothetical protein